MLHVGVCCKNICKNVFLKRSKVMEITGLPVGNYKPNYQTLQTKVLKFFGTPEFVSIITPYIV